MTQDERRRNVRQVLASQRLEGWEPDEAFLALLERYISGEIDLTEVSAEIDRQFGIRPLAG